MTLPIHTPAPWSVVIPVKSPASAKSRLSVPWAKRSDLARAIAADTLAAVAGCPQVHRIILVTPASGETSHLALPPRTEIVHDTAHSLRAAITLGLAAARDSAYRAVLLGDLPALHSDDLGDALAQAALRSRSFVADADGTGTTLATARPGTPFPVLFGRDSASAHRDADFHEIALPATSGLRRDVDTATHLRSLASSLDGGGLGQRTRAVFDTRA